MQNPRSESPDGPFANWSLNAAVLWEVALLAAVIYVPFVQPSFGTFSLATSDWLLTVGRRFPFCPPSRW